jgi:hypothetical protein
MIKKSLLVVFFSSLSILVFAQWGIKTGVNFSSFIGYSNAGYKTGFHIGATYDKALSRKFYFQPGLSFLLCGTKFGLLPGIIKTGDVSIYALELPLTFSLRPKIGEATKFVTDFGLYARYGLFGTKKYEHDETPTIKGSTFPVYNRFDMGLSLGLGFEYRHYSISGTCQLGLVDAEKDVMSLNQTLRINLGYRF